MESEQEVYGHANGKGNATEREITQTDHLNRKLLDSFLARLNSGESQFPAVQGMETSDGTDLHGMESEGQEVSGDANATKREITQTDHLNRKLLDSFLARLNSGESQFPAVQGMETSDGTDLHGMESEGQEVSGDANATKREITQTDHLNRRLLDSFLARLNSGESQFPAMQGMDTSDGTDQAVATEENHTRGNAQGNNHTGGNAQGPETNPSLKE